MRVYDSDQIYQTQSAVSKKCSCSVSLSPCVSYIVCVLWYWLSVAVAGHLTMEDWECRNKSRIEREKGDGMEEARALRGTSVYNSLECRLACTGYKVTRCHHFCPHIMCYLVMLILLILYPLIYKWIRKYIRMCLQFWVVPCWRGVNYHLSLFILCSTTFTKLGRNTKYREHRLTSRR